jgi:maltokinase
MPGTGAQTTADVERALAGWLPGQRWFGGKGSEITRLTVVSETLLAGDGSAGDGLAGDGLADPALWHYVVTVAQGETSVDYQILVGLRYDLPGRLEHAVIGTLPGGRVAYDALHDHELTSVLLRDMIGQADRGALRLRSVPGGPFADDPQLGADLESLVLTGEQSNTSLVFGEEAILKVFRRVSPGPNPDLEVSAALARLGSPHVAEPYGWMETGPMETGPGDGDPADITILAILSQYLRAATDAWTLAATSVRDLYAEPDTTASDAGGDFAGEAHRLGAATAEVHRDLVTAFGRDDLPPGAGADLAAGMRRRLDEALTAVPVLRDHAALLQQAYDDLAAYPGPVPVQRIHGDYHLGQAMRTMTDWVLLDFEGEPAVPLATRRALFSPLRDVAGMLRSFDYAARHQLLDNPNRETLELTARDWVARNCDAFCAGYAEACGYDPRDSSVLLRAFELDKAVYEVLYEARNRPSWLPIPLDSLAAMESTRVNTPGSRAGEPS